ncbi:MAG: indolepyruvate ferredoxin oxidoreductase subunit alpha, partial [Thermoplasmata archaeon]|nr:indolepyruvate ferredoxin oxidoreductase subunit alpha [Thermoplasmata archaeon]
MHELLTDEPGKKMILLGNEAIVRGAVEAGCRVAATYPGTPSSEIGNTLHRMSKDAGIYFEFSANEKVAFEIAGAAAVAGVRAFSFMKHVGLNVASDAFMTMAYTGVRGGYVVLSADDPQCHSSQNEQDNR